MITLQFDLLEQCTLTVSYQYNYEHRNFDKTGQRVVLFNTILMYIRKPHSI